MTVLPDSKISWKPVSVMSEFRGSNILQMRISRAGGQLIKSWFTSAGLLLPRVVCASSLLPSSLGPGWVFLALWNHTKCTLQCFRSSLSATKICSCSRDDEVGLGQGLARSETVVFIYKTTIITIIYMQTRTAGGRGKRKSAGRKGMKKTVFSPSFF